MKTLTKTILRSDDLSCPSCVNNIESNLNKKDGVEKATVHFSTGRIEVEHLPDVISEEELVEVVRQSGYESRVSPF
ncbi:MAG: heavy-metal-associated domain-containing protein [Cyclonatronaceae bacterium]